MKMVKYELAVVYKKDLILTMEEDVDSEEVLKIFLETLKENEKNQGESLKPLKKWKEKKRMLQFIGGLVIGGIFGVVLMCLLQINKTG